MGIILFVILISIISFILVFKDTEYNHARYRSNKVDDNLENLHKIQNYEFWRNFEERGKQTKKK